MSIPVANRIADVDALRGFALLGILLVNITAFSSVFYGLDIADPNFDSPADRTARFLITALFEMKFYLLFSFLFGYSFTLQMRSAECAGEGFTPRLLRRQIGLWLIGLLHAVFLYHGDILTTYAVLGIVLLLLRQSDTRLLLRVAVWLVVTTAAVWALVGLLLTLDATPVDRVAIEQQAQAAMQAYGGTPFTVIAQHMHELSSMWLVLMLVQAPSALAMFLIGFVAGKKTLLARPSEHSALLQRLVVAGLCVGLPGALLYAYTSVFAVGTPWAILGLAISLLTAPLLTGGYVAALVGFFASPLGGTLRNLLAPTGRMALSNYVAQSLACSVIFHAYGLRLVGQISPWSTILIAIAIFAIQLLISRWWIGRFNYGPVEWLLRALTIGAWPTWRRPLTVLR